MRGLQFEKKAICRQYRHATKVRKQIRKDREEKDHCREQTRQQKKFMADKNAFAKELFNPPNATVPTFDVNIAYEHFTNTNEDKTRNVMLKAMPGWSRPKKPEHPFLKSAPTRWNLEDAVRNKKAKCAAGMNGIPYLVYKKCPGILKFLLEIMIRVW